ncbi:ThuA domain-containing protein [Rathayibacter soli]|uniref:ThuA domain-containing protein n=1 Tax=Rathayibacter soli TaxID=3144168 RepID=UPI0027E45FAC|nr:ThuA domain-containing protein [Glaciibacter superstes]
MQRILLFTKTTGYRHDSMEAGVDAVTQLAAAAGVVVDHTEDSAVFTTDSLQRYAAVVWLNVSGDVLDQDGRRAFASYLRAGGGFAAIHGPADAEWSWPEYDTILGARFLFHPREHQFQRATMRSERHGHASTAELPNPWVWTDEFYAFKSNPRPRVSVLLTVDESTYDPELEPMGADHPVSWTARYGAGRTWYTALGHNAEAYSDAEFRSHLWGGISSVIADIRKVDN